MQSTVKPQPNPSDPFDEEFMTYQRSLFLSLFNNPSERRGENRFERFMREKISKNQNQQLSSASSSSTNQRRSNPTTSSSFIPKLIKTSKIEVTDKFASIVEVEKSETPKNLPSLKINIVEKVKTLPNRRPKRLSAITALNSFQHIDDDDDDDSAINGEKEENITKSSLQDCQQQKLKEKRKSSEMKRVDDKNDGYNPPKSKIIKLVDEIERKDEKFEETIATTQRKPRQAAIRAKEITWARTMKTSATIRKTPKVPRKSRKTSETPSPESSPTNDAIVINNGKPLNSPSNTKRQKFKKSITPARSSESKAAKRNSCIASFIEKSLPTPPSKSSGVDRKSINCEFPSPVPQKRSKMTLIPKSWREKKAIDKCADTFIEVPEVFVSMSRYEYEYARMKEINTLNNKDKRRTRNDTSKLEKVVKRPTNIRFAERNPSEMDQNEFLFNFGLLNKNKAF